MKIDRRSFLSFAIGGAAGIHLSPLPWKLMDDVSIWSQNWPWTPVPEDGEVSYVNSTCTLCPGGCGISVRKIDDRAVKIEGMKDHPVNDGGLCILGLSGLQLLYGPTRVKTPLKRKGKRGAGKWEKISWDKAISEIVQKLSKLRSKGESHTVGCILGSDRGTVPQLFHRFLSAYGSPNLMHTPSIQDSYELTFNLMHGIQTMVGFDIENTGFVLSFGSGIIEGWGSPVRMFKANSKWRDAATKVVQIEPRLSNTAAKSTKWFPINPGTETTLALGLIHVIIKESLYNRDFVDNYSTGFNNLKKFVLSAYSPDKVANVTGVDINTIVSLARDFARAKKPLAICGRGKGVTPGSMSEFMAVHALNALVGNINREGGVWAVPEPDYIGWPEVEMDSIATKGIQKERIDGAGGKKYPFSKHLLNRFPEIINSGKGYPLQALFVSGANPLYSMPDTKSVKEAFDKILFVVSFSSFMDETSENADLILPNHAYLERYEDVPLAVGLQKPVVGLTRPVVEPLFNTKHVGDVVIRMAKALGGNISDSFPWDSYESCLEETMEDMWDTLVEDGFWSDPDFTAPAWESAFDTSSGKFEFTSNGIKSFTRLDQVKIEGDVSSYPLTLIPYDSMRLACGFIGDPPFVIKTVEDTVLKGKDLFIEINPKTAKANGLSEGKYAILSTPIGKAKVKIHLFDGIMPGIVAIPRGLGHTAYDKYLADKGINFNELIGPVEDPVSGLDAAWGIRAKLAKI
jgi:anaerobic selenocysteine-containing dehydrogenase